MDGEGNYLIENVLYRDNNGCLTEVPLREAPGFENIPPVVKTGSPYRQFVIDRLNIANNAEYTNPMGIPAFANAIDQLKGADVAYDSYINEFVLGKKRIIVKPAATKTFEGEPVFDPNDVTYYVLDEDGEDKNIIQPIDMTLRTAEHNAGLQDMLNALSSRCGFGENHYRFDNGSVATATQVISENSTLYRTIKKHEIILNDALEELARIILRLGNSVLHLGLNEDVKISIDFDDSIIEDTRTELQDMRADVAAGLIRGELYVAKKYGVSEEEAIKMMPGMEDLTDEEEKEIE
ncbi:MAG: phage portal protein [Oscillibacter sp.]|nr:phage portal protein [Oscillibacter sp.]